MRSAAQEIFFVHRNVAARKVGEVAVRVEKRVERATDGGRINRFRKFRFARNCADFFPAQTRKRKNPRRFRRGFLFRTAMPSQASAAANACANASRSAAVLVSVAQTSSAFSCPA
jgi:hypothetical protein